MPSAKSILILAAVAALAGCDLLGEPAESILARKEAEGRAVGSACRHANRAIEDCYTLNRKAQKAAVFAGWREMDEYMRENKMEGIEPVLAKAQPKTGGASEAEADGEEADAHGEASDAKGGGQGHGG